MGRESPSDREAALQSATVAAWLAAQASLNTRAAYRADLDVFGRWCVHQGSIPLQADTPALVAFLAAREAAGDRSSTLRRRWSALSSFYQFAVDADLARSNPVLGAPRPKASAGNPSTTVSLSSQAVRAYLDLAAALDPRLDALVSLLVHDGLKLSEALALDVDDVVGRPPKVSLTIRRRGAERRIVLEADSGRAVRRCVGRRRGGPLFTRAQAAHPDEPGARLTRFGADHLIKQLNTTSDDRATANSLRRSHFAATHAAGTDLDRIRDRTGLADVRGVRRYLARSANADSGSRSDDGSSPDVPDRDPSG